MVTIAWCLKTKNGIELVEPSKNVADAYIQKAETCLQELRTVKTKEWKITTAYYTMYFSLYALFMRVGIKCEIHSCTIASMPLFFFDYFTKEQFLFMKDACTARNDAQYYVDHVVSEEIQQKMEKEAPLFFLHCKHLVVSLDEKSVEKIRLLVSQKISQTRKK